MISIYNLFKLVLIYLLIKNINDTLSRERRHLNQSNESTSSGNIALIIRDDILIVFLLELADQKHMTFQIIVAI